MTIFYESESKKILKSKLKTDQYSVLHSPLKITIQTENDEVDGLELVLEASIDMSVDDDHVDYDDDDDNDDNDDS